MAKAKLDWTKINLETSDPQLMKLWKAEQAATEATNKHIAKLVADSQTGVKAEQVRVGRMWGNVSYAIDATATNGKGAVSLGGGKAK